MLPSDRQPAVEHRGNHIMTTVQNRTWQGSNWPSGSASAAGAVLLVATAGLVLAIVGVAMSARPITEPAPLAISAFPPVAAPERAVTITGAQEANAYMQSLENRWAQGQAASAAQTQSIAAFPPVAAPEPAVAISGADQANAYMLSLEAKWASVHAQSVAQTGAVVAFPPVAAPEPAVAISGADQANAYLQFLLARHATAVAQTQAVEAFPPVAAPEPAVAISGADQANAYMAYLLARHAEGVAGR